MRHWNARMAVTSVMIVIMLLFALFSVVLAADPTAEASRTIDPQVVEPGQEVEITVEFTSLLTAKKGFAMQEVLPEGWEFTRGTDDADVFKSSTVEWVWIEVEAGATKTVTYNLTVPINAEPGDYTIVGTVTADGVLNPIGGHTTMTVPGDPTVTTQAATAITTSSATLNMVYTVAYEPEVEVRFAHRKSGATTWSYTDWVSKTADGSHSEALGGLDSATDYEFKAQLRYDTTVIEGTTSQFKTATPPTPPAPPPIIGCWIATAAYGSPSAEEINILREFRDVVLLESEAGSRFVTWYYQTSPPIADFIAGNEVLRTLVRELLVDPVVWLVESTGPAWRN